MKFAARHLGCYSDGFNSKFPTVSVECFNMQLIGTEAVDLFRLHSAQDQFDKVLHYLKNHSTINKISILEKTKDELYLKIVSRETGKVKTISQIVFNNNCHALKSLFYEDDKEVWTIGSSSKENFNKVLTELHKIAKVNVFYIKKSQFVDFLSNQQRRAILTAKILGYYEWPRRASATKIAKELGLSKTALLSALRIAESKIISKYL